MLGPAYLCQAQLCRLCRGGRRLLEAAAADRGGVQAEDARQSWTHRAAAGSIERQAKYMHSRVQDHVSGNPTGVSVTWLGTSSGAPTRTRNNSGIALRATSGGRDDIMLVDTGTLPPLPPPPPLHRAARRRDAADQPHGVGEHRHITPSGRNT